jgi:hypothetical protein
VAHRRHRQPGRKRTDELQLANLMVLHDGIADSHHDLVVGDEAWDIDHFLHEPRVQADRPRPDDRAPSPSMTNAKVMMRSLTQIGSGWGIRGGRRSAGGRSGRHHGSRTAARFFRLTPEE